MKISGPREPVVGPLIQSAGHRLANNRVKAVAIRLLWLVIFLVHAVCANYYAFVALVYYELPQTIVGEHIAANQLMMDMSVIPVLVVAFGFCAALHAVYLTEMLVKTATRRSLYFHARAFKLIGAFIKANSRRTLVVAQAKIGSVPKLKATSLRRAERTALSVWERSFGVTGYFGVGGKYFALLFLVRETVEAVLQSFQAHSLSEYVPGVWLNRSAVAIVVASCWSTPMLYKLLHKSPRVQLIACLLTDTLLSVASSIGTPVAIEATYFPYYNAATRSFDSMHWSDNAWVANLNSEFKQLFIQSWSDMGRRLLFALTLLMSLDDVKLLAAALAADTDSDHVVPRAPKEIPVTKARQRFEKLVHSDLIIWGFDILGLHFSSVVDEADLVDCMVPVRPWLATQATCVALSIDCLKHEGMVGTPAELEARWTPLDAQAVRLLILTGCPELRVPASIRSFPNLMGFYILFSTVLEWSESAALSGAYHPNLRQISLALVNMSVACESSSSLPPGLLARDFPPTLGIFLVIAVALDKLPPDLPEIWPRGLTLLLMGANLNDVPEVLLHMAPVRLSLQFNNISRLPAAIFEIPTLKWLDMSWTTLKELPEYAEPSEALTQINVERTAVANLPEWMSNESFLSRVQVIASMTPLCGQLGAALDAPSKALARHVC